MNKELRLLSVFLMVVLLLTACTQKDSRVDSSDDSIANESSGGDLRVEGKDNSNETNNKEKVILAYLYPDIITHGMGMPDEYPGGGDKAIKDGNYLALNDLVESHAPNFKKIIETDEELRKDILTDEGNIWTTGKSGANAGGFWVLEPWETASEDPNMKLIGAPYPSLKKDMS